MGRLDPVFVRMYDADMKAAALERENRPDVSQEDRVVRDGVAREEEAYRRRVLRSEGLSEAPEGEESPGKDGACEREQDPTVVLDRLSALCAGGTLVRHLVGVRIMTTTELDLTTDERDWLEEALYELKGLRGWAWDSKDYAHYEEIVRGIGGVVD